MFITLPIEGLHFFGKKGKRETIYCRVTLLCTLQAWGLS